VLDAREPGHELGKGCRQGRLGEMVARRTQSMPNREDYDVLDGVGVVRQAERTGAAKTQHPLFPFTRTRLVSARMVAGPVRIFLADTSRKQI
jgi:hypothetical protein